MAFNLWLYLHHNKNTLLTHHLKDNFFNLIMYYSLYYLTHAKNYFLALNF